MNQAIKQITDILTVCGCKPATTNENGKTVIKVNAPEIKSTEELKQ